MNYNEAISAEEQKRLERLCGRVTDMYYEVRNFADDSGVSYDTALELYKVTLLSDANYHLEYIGSSLCCNMEDQHRSDERL